MHWPSAGEALAAEGAVHDLERTYKLCDGEHASDDGTSILKIPEMRHVPGARWSSQRMLLCSDNMIKLLPKRGEHCEKGLC